MSYHRIALHVSRYNNETATDLNEISRR